MDVGLPCKLICDICNKKKKGAACFLPSLKKINIFFSQVDFVKEKHLF